MRRAIPLAALATLVASFPTPAQAAVPKRSYDGAMLCRHATVDNPVKWWSSRGRSAVENDCPEQWVVITTYSNGDQKKVVNVAPGAHFNWRRKRLPLDDPETEIWVSEGPRRCADPGAVALAIYRGSHGKPVLLDCPDDAPR